ncbi:MAG: S-layer homology domain-containing protein [Oscillospiraceae bacterium]|nr:S-layer homology domain-containing protein [Oscillospiraceae bacterium]
MKAKYLLLVLTFVLALALIPVMDASAADGPVITKQPEDVTVAYPEGASFSVEVENPDEVASYQWMMRDQAGSVFELNGSSAKTDTVIIPSTQQSNDVLDFYCVITDKDGNETESEPGHLDMNNREVNKPVFYVGEYAVEPGETLDLSTVDIGDGYKLGSGTVSYDSNGTDITISNLDYDNSHTMCDLIVAPNVALDMQYYKQDKEEYNITFVGDNKINNTYYDYDYNVGGIPVDFYFNGECEKPLVNFIGDGTLTITNGTNAIRVIGDLMIDIDVTVRQTVKLYADGVVAENVKVAEGSKLDMEVYGVALYAQNGNLFIDGADITVDAHAPYVSVGVALKNLFQAAGDIMINNSAIKATSSVEYDTCKAVAGYTGFSAGGDFFAYTSDISYEASATEHDSVYASDFCGISASNGTVEDSTVKISIDSPYIFGGSGIYGIYTDADLSLARSDVSVDIHSSGSPYGIAVEKVFAVDDSNVNVDVSSYPDFGEFSCYGILCENAAINLSDAKNQVHSKVVNGLAVGCNLGLEVQDEPVEYAADYEAKNISLGDGVECLSPEDAAVSTGSVVMKSEQDDSYLPVETFYSLSDTSKAAEEVLIGIKADDNPPDEHVCPAAPFTDVDISQWYHEGIDFAIESGLMNGVAEDRFDPQGTTTRAMIVTILYRLDGEPAVDGENAFDDVEAGQWYTDAVVWANSNEIVNGYGEGKFGPADNITREQFATILFRYAQFKGYDVSVGEDTNILSYNDAFDISEWAMPAMQWACGAELMNGDNHGNLLPADGATRAQAATLFMRFSTIGMDEPGEEHPIIDVKGCETFTQIVDEKLEAGMGYATVTIDGTDVLLVSSGTFNNNPEGEPFEAAIDAEVYFYGADGSIGYMGYLRAGGTAYPLAIGDGKLFVGRNHGMAKYTVDPDLGVALIDNEAWVEFDSEGNETYHHRSDVSGSMGEDGVLPDDSVMKQYLEEYGSAEVIEFSTVAEKA